ncbi:MAG: hypothetical protein KAV82_14100 [Phycisphaerae bacterium]|nr:hypothetical protein [Phycisphaerae bacterium]
MKKSMFSALLIVFGMLASQPALAGSWHKSSLGQAEFGKLWSGDAFDVRDLAGKVVLVYWWTDG